MKKAVFAALACCVLCTGMSKKPKATISIHSEGASEDNPRMVFPETIEGQRMIFKLVPEFSQVNIAAIHPFPAEDGNGFGLALKLDFRGTNALDIVTRTRQGGLLLTKVNGRSCGFVSIDRPVSDGIFTIWSGVPEEVVKELQKKHPDISHARSAGHGIDMAPTTKKEKRDALRHAEELKKQEKEEAKKKDKPLSEREKAAAIQEAIPTGTLPPGEPVVPLR